tara:strand:- start:1367 stop:2593 length:1227 start_codon:yes stop_codon:yes gene_type:complete
MSEVTIILIIYLAAKLFLDIIQIYTIKTVKIDKNSASLLGMSNEDDVKSRGYNTAKLYLSMIKSIIYVGWIYLFLSGGLINYINESLKLFLLSEYLINLFTILISFIFIYLSMIPLSYYSTFVIETKYSFNTSSKLLFIKDNLTSMTMTLILLIILSTIFFSIVSNQDIWWLLMASTIFLLIIMSMYIYPTYISPLFNKFNNLENEEIEKEIEDLSSKTDFNIENLYVMDKSKRSKHPNAYFTGFKNNRRIVFYDTLIDLLSPSEIKAVLAHEIGHYKHNHIIKSLFLSTVVIFVGMYFLSLLINNTDYILALNLPLNSSSQLLALVFSYQIISFFIDPFFSILSRKNEYEADNFASNQVDKSFLISSLVKLYKSNLTFLMPSKIYAAFYFSHPTVLERIDNLRNHDE